MALNTSMNALLHGMDARRISIEPQRCISVRNRKEGGLEFLFTLHK